MNLKDSHSNLPGTNNLHYRTAKCQQLKCHYELAPRFRTSFKKTCHRWPYPNIPVTTQHHFSSPDLPRLHEQGKMWPMVTHKYAPAAFLHTSHSNTAIFFRHHEHRYAANTDFTIMKRATLRSHDQGNPKTVSATLSRSKIAPPYPTYLASTLSPSSKVPRALRLQHSAQPGRGLQHNTDPQPFPLASPPRTHTQQPPPAPLHQFQKPLLVKPSTARKTAGNTSATANRLTKPSSTVRNPRVTPVCDAPPQIAALQIHLPKADGFPGIVVTALHPPQAPIFPQTVTSLKRLQSGRSD